MAEAKRDGNHVTTLLGVSSADGVTPINPWVDPTTHRLLVDLPTAGGTVTSVSVVTANGFAGSVATATTTPAITLSTTVNAPALAGNGTAIAAATTTGSGSTVVLATAPTFGTSITTPAVLATANDSGALGASGTAFSDLYLASGGIIDWNAGNMVITHTAGALTITGGTLSAPQFSPTGSTATGNRFYLPASNTLGFSTNGTGRVQISTTAMSPITDDGFALGTTALEWSDLFLASGGVVNFNNGNFTLTHSSGILTASGDLRVSSAGTNSASVPTLSSTSTLTNKRITRRTATTNAPGATPTTNSDNVDLQIFTGLAAAITSMTTNLSGTPNTGDFLEFWLTDDGTARAITWGASFAATTVALPTTTVISTKLRVLFEWGGSTWDCVATA